VTATIARPAVALAPAPDVVRPAAARRRSVGQDLLKALAIVAVIAQHAIPGAQLHRLWDVFWVDQAVPVFLVLFGLNAAGSFQRSGARSLGELYSPAYLRSRVRRLVVPVLAVYALIAAVGTVQGRAHLGPLVLLGAAPIAGGAPGDYFVGLAVSLALLLPAIWWAFLRRPGTTIAAMLLVSVVFELIARHVLLGPSAGQYLDVACPLRALAAVAAGIWVADRGGPHRVLAEQGRGVVLFAAISAAFLVALQIDTLYGSHDAFGVLYPNFTPATSVFAVGWSLALTLGGIVALDRLGERRRSPAVDRLALVGRASYHVFLVQAAVFGLWHSSSPFVRFGEAVLAIAVGIAFWLADDAGARRAVLR
jgi:peptidoglycan/LPS O-acetylase OafA/YrhL